jgi:hypothetical protein
MIPFGEWLPDQSDLQNPGSTVAKNVLPAARGYRPFASLTELSGAATERLRGIYATKATDGTVLTFAGDDDDLYKLNTTTFALDSINSGYTMSGDTYWKFVRFGDEVIACGNDTDGLQGFTVGTDSAFAAISGAPAAREIAVVRDFVVTGNVTYSSATHRSRVRWSAINDASSWTLGTDQADFQDIPDAGQITGLVGGEFGVVLMERAIARMQYVGSPLIFTFEKVETNHGCNYPNSVASLGASQVFYLADDGFFMFNGQKSIPIGAEKVDQFFFDDLDFANSDRISCTIDPENQVVMWGYPSVNGIGNPDRILVYNYAVQKWALVELDHELLSSSLTPTFSLEALDTLSSSLDDLTTSLDSRFYSGGFFQLSAGKDKKIHTITGAPLEATLETTEFEPANMRHSLIRSVTPYVTTKGAVAPTVTSQLASRTRQIDGYTYGSAVTLNNDNTCPIRGSGRYHRVRVNVNGDWRYALGVDIDASAMGKR